MRLPALIFLVLFPYPAIAQDSATAALRGTVTDPQGGLVVGAQVVLRDVAKGIERTVETDREGRFTFALLAPGEYEMEVSRPGFAVATKALSLAVGADVSVQVPLKLASADVKLEVTAADVVETQTATISDVIDQRAIDEFPLNGRRFSDLALVTGAVTQDPRGLTSSSNGDLAFGGLRGFHTNFLVDGSDNNNAFFSQARGRYRAPYQFSNETVQEFRVSSNTYGAELGRSAGAVVNVITRSGTNQPHGTLFYYLRDGKTSATHPFVRKKYADKQHQFGGTLGGPIKRGKTFFYLGFDQHVFHVPTVVQFDNGTPFVTPTAQDFEARDQQLVVDAAAQLSQEGGNYRSQLLGNAALAKFDWIANTRNQIVVRLNLSRYFGENNVFFDPASPITSFGISSNGEERVATESANASWTSVWGRNWRSHLRAQFSRDLQDSLANSNAPRTIIDDVISGTGRSSILPRQTNEKKWHVAETVSYENSRHTLKFGGDAMIAKISNYFPSLFGGQYIFDSIRVNPFTFQPQTFGLTITPLRAYAHAVSRFYSQNFGSSTSHPDTNDYALFAQDTMRLGNHLALVLGLRYDRQTFRKLDAANPVWPDAGIVPSDKNNFAPRLGLAASIGNYRPLVLRGGFGLFYAHVPSIYASSVEIDNGLNRQHLLLDNSNANARPFFPVYPNVIQPCGAMNQSCPLPSNLAGFATTEISSFARDYKTPYAEQASLSVEKEIAKRTAVGGSYLFVAGKHLIRARDVNLPAPTTVTYPIYDETGTNFIGDYYQLQTFSKWRFAPSLTCPFPPCIDPLQRPISSVGAINVYETRSSSLYHAFTLSAKRRMSDGLYFRLAYTWAHAIDYGQDSLLTGSSQVQNSADVVSERGTSTTDQRHRLTLAWTAEPKPFGREQVALRRIFNSWRLSGILAAGSGRPLTGRVSGDANRDGNSDNDRLPGLPRNSFTGPTYYSTDMRITRMFRLADRLKMEATAESFNIFNHANKRVDVSDEGFSNVAASFVAVDKQIGSQFYPAHFRRNSNFLQPTNAYAPRQVQFAIRLKF